MLETECSLVVYLLHKNTPCTYVFNLLPKIKSSPAGIIPHANLQIAPKSRGTYFKTPSVFPLEGSNLTVHMAKRRTKKRTHAKANGAVNGPGRPGGTNRSPKSMVIRMGAGEVGPSITQLAKDVRAMMEPDTASRLKVCFSAEIH